MKNLSFTTLALFVVFASCGSESNRLPDGGYQRLQCLSSTAVVAVRVVDTKGQPIEGADVTAINSSGTGITGKTNGSGISADVTESLGAGYVHVSAREGNRVSPSYDVQFVCGECGCHAFPQSLTLALPAAQ